MALSLVAIYHGETRVDLLVAFLPTLMAPNPDADCIVSLGVSRPAEQAIVGEGGREPYYMFWRFRLLAFMLKSSRKWWDLVQVTLVGKDLGVGVTVFNQLVCAAMYAHRMPAA